MNQAGGSVLYLHETTVVLVELCVGNIGVFRFHGALQFQARTDSVEDDVNLVTGLGDLGTEITWLVDPAPASPQNRRARQERYAARAGLGHVIKVTEGGESSHRRDVPKRPRIGRNTG